MRMARRGTPIVEGMTCMFENQITITGNVCNDPEVRVARNGEEYAAFRVAAGTRRRNSETGLWEDGETSFYRVTAWRALGSNLARSVRKGHPVLVHGRLRISRFVREDNVPLVSADITADAVGHNLALGQASFARPGGGLRAAPDPSGEPLYDPAEEPADTRSAGRAVELTTPYDGDYDLVDQVTGEVRTMSTTDGPGTERQNGEEVDNPLATAV